MSLSAAHSAAFRREVPLEGRVWSIRDSGGFPAPRGTDGTRAMPFWSKRSRAERIVGAVGAYRGFEVVEIPVAEWLGSWLPGLDRDDRMKLIPEGEHLHSSAAECADRFEQLACRVGVAEPAEVMSW